MFKNKLVFILFLFVFLSACSDELDPLQTFNAGNYETSFTLWKELADRGDNTAQNYLGIQYYLGLGVERNIKQAFHWYETSAKAGNPEAQRNLGAMYESGVLGNRDFEKAYIWLYAAYKQGNSNAAKTLESISGQLSPGRVRKLKKLSIQYVLNDIVDPERDDF
ncbi:MAG: hypothetical protein DHS20C09_16040 [marine bacterium B5-7]|nr:MAG: hypothetical protein DHS20C09_16040 [marine bacterium B5-7]